MQFKTILSWLTLALGFIDFGTAAPTPVEVGKSTCCFQILFIFLP